eukprot:TRINITY_DN19963_c0_g1_i1.p1 TRINITY_DN19963_c0_g1~~TRINITY_DN19963_c0_g1_i1.p1  ORF type:complete len:133 (-),score=34.66 TRINITY_DN19963_c0_g1_i1:56-454(-)
MLNARASTPLWDLLEEAEQFEQKRQQKLQQRWMLEEQLASQASARKKLDEQRQREAAKFRGKVLHDQLEDLVASLETKARLASLARDVKDQMEKTQEKRKRKPAAPTKLPEVNQRMKFPRPVVDYAGRMLYY